MGGSSITGASPCDIVAIGAFGQDLRWRSRTPRAAVAVRIVRPTTTVRPTGLPACSEIVASDSAIASGNGAPAEAGRCCLRCGNAIIATSGSSRCIKITIRLGVSSRSSISGAIRTALNVSACTLQCATRYLLPNNLPNTVHSSTVHVGNRAPILISHLPALPPPFPAIVIHSLTYPGPGRIARWSRRADHKRDMVRHRAVAVGVSDARSGIGSRPTPARHVAGTAASAAAARRAGGACVSPYALAIARHRHWGPTRLRRCCVRWRPGAVGCCDGRHARVPTPPLAPIRSPTPIRTAT